MQKVHCSSASLVCVHVFVCLLTLDCALTRVEIMYKKVACSFGATFLTQIIKVCFRVVKHINVTRIVVIFNNKFSYFTAFRVFEKVRCKIEQFIVRQPC